MRRILEVLVFLITIAVLAAIPALLVWALDVLSGASIPLSLETYGAAAVLLLILYGVIHGGEDRCHCGK